MWWRLITCQRGKIFSRLKGRRRRRVLLNIEWCGYVDNFVLNSSRYRVDDGCVGSVLVILVVWSWTGNGKAVNGLIDSFCLFIKAELVSILLQPGIKLDQKVASVDVVL